MRVEAGLASQATNANNNARKGVFPSGKSLTWHSFRHADVAFQLTLNETPMTMLAARCDSSIQDIEDHCFHNRAEPSTRTLAQGRNALKAATGDLKWLQIRPKNRRADPATQINPTRNLLSPGTSPAFV
jgi:hypothetical protein